MLNNLEPFQKLISKTAVAIYVVQDNRVIYANPATLAMYGYSEGHLTGKSMTELIHPDDRESVLESHQACLLGKEFPTTFSNRIVSAEGEIKHVEVNVVLSSWEGRPATYCVQTDVTERKQTEDRLRDSEIRNRALLDGSPVCNKIIDLDSRLLYMSAAGVKDLKIQDIEPFYGSIYPPEFFPETTRAVLTENLERAKAGEICGVESPMHDIEGNVVWFDTTFVPARDEEGRVNYVIATSVNITERKISEDRLRQSQKMEAVGQLTGGVAHDFNNLLSVVQGNAELLKDKVGTDDLPLAEAILRASERGAELTHRLLAYSRKQSLQSKPIDLGGLVFGMDDLLVRSLGETIEIEIKVGQDLWPIYADPGQVENALLNLVLNARDAMSRGGKLKIECMNATMDTDYVEANPETELGDYVIFSVADTGIGMSEEIRAQVFEPFFTTKDVGEGSGLGLSMIYGFVAQSGGYVTIDSAVGQGTTVKVFLPRALETGARTTEIVDIDTPLGQQEVVLVVEDNVDVQTMVATMLERLGYRVVMASTATEARGALEQEKNVDVILSDIVLPGGVSGLDFAEEVRASNPDVNVIFMSGYSQDLAKFNGNPGHENEFLCKPFTREKLADALSAALH